MNFAVGSASDVGRHRAENEDALLVDDSHRLYAVADGMGGHRAGEVASATAIEALRATFAGPTTIAEAVAKANEAVVDKAAGNAEMRGMGTTLTALSLDGPRAVLGHVGDSRAYLLRDGDLTQITEDHSLVEQMVREGRLTPEQAEVHPQRSIITRALGIERDVEVDSYEIDLHASDRILLCSDGLTTMVREPAIAAVLRREHDPARAARSLVDLANEAGGDDNITVIVVDALGDPHEEGLAAADALAGEPVAHEATGQWEIDGSTGTSPTEPAATAARETGTPAGRPARHRSRHRLARVLVWVLPVLVVLGAAAGALGWYARSNYYVGIDHGRVTVFRGVPDGLLGWQPTVEHHYPTEASALTPAQHDDLTRGHKFSSKVAAQRFANRLATAATTTTTTPATPPTSTP